MGAYDFGAGVGGREGDRKWQTADRARADEFAGVEDAAGVEGAFDGAMEGAIKRLGRHSQTRGKLKLELKPQSR